LDIAKHRKSFAAGNARGYYSDAVHQSVAGYGDMADLHAQALSWWSPSSAFGPELINPAGWDTTGTATTVSDGVLTTTGTGAWGLLAQQAVTYEVGARYRLSMDNPETPGQGLQVALGARVILLAFSAGTNTVDFTAIGSDNTVYIFEGIGGDFVGSVSNITLRKIL
jgi:hypothetical protein